MIEALLLLILFALLFPSAFRTMLLIAFIAVMWFIGDVSSGDPHQKAAVEDVSR